MNYTQPLRERAPWAPEVLQGRLGSRRPLASRPCGRGITRVFARASALAFAAVVSLTGAAGAAEIRVMISGGLSAAYEALVPEFERTSPRAAPRWAPP
jgi:hypothetical protein